MPHNLIMPVKFLLLLDKAEQELNNVASSDESYAPRLGVGADEPYFR